MQKNNLFQRLKTIFFKNDNAPILEDLEDVLIEADLGYKTASTLSLELEKAAKTGKLKGPQDLREALKKILVDSLLVKELSYNPQTLNVYLFLGVNGVGKTTSIAKLAYWLNQKDRGPIVLAAGDTFRAAAVEQIKLHGKRQGLRVIGQENGSDPGAVLFDGITSAKAQGERVLLGDTAGRMHNKANLVKELQKIDKIVQSKIENGVYQKILVIDSTTGQNAYQQAQVFHEAIGVDGIILSKYDSSSRGGIAISICKELKIPFLFFGTGEKITDLEVFDPQQFAEGILGDS